MAVKCPTCRSADTVAGLQNNQCHRCGKLFDNEGNVVEAGMDASTREAIEARLAPRQQVVIGNLADLQRAGADAAANGKATFGAGVALPPSEGLPHNGLVTPAQAEHAQGRVTVETERVGLTGGGATTSKAKAKK